jgi:glutamyl-tRNA synthetase
MSVRTRFAPSPTGPLHMGGVRTALYAWLFARKHNGQFLLRVEDTDQNRFVPGAEEYIIEALRWCGIIPDEGVGFGGPHTPYRQSERKELGFYMDYAQQLIKAGQAYYAFDTPEALDQQRKNAEAAGKHGWQYDATTRMHMSNSLTMGEADVKAHIDAGKPYVIRLKVDPGTTITFTDMVRGEVSFDSSLVDDKVMIKADGMPTYHLAHIVDDILMGITHAIRGEEWLPSAPAHILIYEFLGLRDKMPQYAHLPLLLKPEGNGKLSKRDGDRLGFPVFPLEWKDPATGEISSGYREKGYYPEAFVNMLAFLGWNPGTEQELFSLDELVAAFSFDHVHKAGARFDPEKTKWFNEQWLRRKSNIELAERLRVAVINKYNFTEQDIRASVGYCEKAVALMKDRVQFESEFLTVAEYLFIQPTGYDEKVIAKRWNDNAKTFFTALINNYAQLDNFTAEKAKAVFEKTAADNGLKPGDVLQLCRVFISGAGSGVDLFGMMELLGREESGRRMEGALKTV